MKGSGHQFLAGAALTVNDYRGLGRGRTLYEIENLAHGRGLADDAVKAVLDAKFPPERRNNPLLGQS